MLLIFQLHSRKVFTFSLSFSQFSRYIASLQYSAGSVSAAISKVLKNNFKSCIRYHNTIFQPHDYLFFIRIFIFIFVKIPSV